MSNQAIEEFGKWLAHHARNGAIWSCDQTLQPDRETKNALRWRAAAAAAGGQVPASIVISESVDSAVSAVLWAVAHEFLCLSFTTEHGDTLYLPVDGDIEMNGLYGCTPGWRTWYSKERIDDRYDLAHISAEYGVEDDTDDPAPIRDELPMPRRGVEELGELLVRHVRDVAIQSCDLQLLPHSQTPVAKRWRLAAAPYDGKVPPRVLIPDCVDEAIFAFLRAIDQGLLRLSFTTENGEMVDLAKEGRGELAARYMSSDGWRAKYSKERFFDNAHDWTPEELAAIAIPKSYHFAQMFDEGRNLTDADITHLEETIGLRLPENYRRFLTTFNGGAPSPNLLDIEGAPYDNIELKLFFSIDIQNEYRELLRRWESVPGCKEKNWLPVGCDAGDACLVLDLNDATYGNVYFIDSDEDPPHIYFVANDFDEMIEKLHHSPQ